MIQASIPCVGRNAVVGQRHVRRPACLRGREEERAVEDHAAEQQQPPREHVQARERDTARPDHQRHEVAREPGEDRHHGQEDHRRAVHGEELVVGRRVEERVVGRAELDPHQQRLDSPEDEEEKCGEQEEDADPLVVGRRDPVDPARPPLGQAAERDLRRRGSRGAGGVFGRRHRQLPPAWGREPHLGFRRLRRAPWRSTASGS